MARSAMCQHLQSVGCDNSDFVRLQIELFCSGLPGAQRGGTTFLVPRWLTGSNQGCPMISSVEFPILVSYSQVTVFDHSTEGPFNQWTSAHVAQGFSWRPGSAAFRTIAESGPHLVTVIVDTIEGEQPADAIRVIEVPFEAPNDGVIEIGSISDSSLLEVPPGTYSLRFECYQPLSGQPARVRFLFLRKANPSFCIVRADPELNSEGQLLLTTSAA
ncbi:competence protein ComJ [Methylocystis heyeri]|uniref:Uncharacterized protein n=1 Tax=Methylocystis heyeri TaxID=391905 RepID=A0A6B8KHW4_9HYPH|nr:hypothetical protein H2LOC_013155 [Methylocystis heyeri]